jgi:hypothetical protein
VGNSNIKGVNPAEDENNLRKKRRVLKKPTLQNVGFFLCY